MITYAETKKKSIVGKIAKNRIFVSKTPEPILGADFELKCTYPS